MSLFPNPTLHPGPVLFPGLTVFPGVARHILTTPAERVDFRFPGTGLWGYTLQGLSLYRVAGEWHVGYVPDPDLIEGLEVLYRGGHRYVLSDAEAAELFAAGLSDYVETKVD